MHDTILLIKESVSIVDVIGEFVRLEPYGSKFKGLCPFHEDHRPSFFVDPHYRNFRCWACGAKGDVFTFLQEHQRLTFAEAKRLLADKAGIDLGDERSARADNAKEVYRVLDWAAKRFQNCLMDSRMGEEARQYLSKRGLRMEAAIKHGLGFAPDLNEWLIHQAKKDGINEKLLLRGGLISEKEWGKRDFFRGRVMFPIRDDRQRVLGFGGRILPRIAAEFESRDFAIAKYKNNSATEVYNKSSVLYGIEVAAEELRRSPQSAERSVVVMEGYTDCLMAYQEGFYRAVATCGTALTEQHIGRLRSLASKVVLTFDGDAEGQKAANRLVGLFLASEVDLKLCVIPGGKDPCDFILDSGIKAFEEAINSAVDPLEYQINRAAEAHGRDGVEGRRRAVEAVLRTISAAPTMAVKTQAIKVELALSRLAEAFGFQESVLRRRINEIRAEGGRPRTVTPPQEDTQAAPEPMDRLERAAVQLLVAQPARAEAIEAILPPRIIKHPLLRRLALEAVALFEDRGEASTTIELRERLDDLEANSLVADLADSAPSGEGFEQGLLDLKSALALSSRRAQRGRAVTPLAGVADEQAHLETLRQWRDRSAANVSLAEGEHAKDS